MPQAEAPRVRRGVGEEEARVRTEVRGVDHTTHTGLDPATFTQHQFLSWGGGAPYDLVVRFDRSAALVARERKWHPSQEEHTAEDGRLELRLRVCGRGDVLRWLLGFGGAVEVLEPAWLRERVRAEAAAMRVRHRRRPAR